MKKTLAIILVIASLLTGNAFVANAVNVSDFLYSSNNKLKRGFIADHLYMNTGFHFAIEFGDDWSLLSKEELIKANKGTPGKDDLDTLFDRNGTIKDMIAYNGTYQGSNISIGIENMKVLEEAVLTEREYCELLGEQFPDEFAKSGYQVEQAVQGTTRFAGATHQSISFVLSYDHVKAYERIVVLVEDDYAAVVIAASQDKAFLDEIFTLFYSPEG